MAFFLVQYISRQHEYQATTKAQLPQLEETHHLAGSFKVRSKSQYTSMSSRPATGRRGGSYEATRVFKTGAAPPRLAALRRLQRRLRRGRWDWRGRRLSGPAPIPPSSVGRAFARPGPLSHRIAWRLTRRIRPSADRGGRGRAVRLEARRWGERGGSGGGGPAKPAPAASSTCHNVSSPAFVVKPALQQQVTA
jgi:hypothetical protein